LSGAYLTLTSEPQTTQAWAAGAKGERELGAFLQRLDDGRTTFVLHDRRMPGSRANIDHLVVTTGGIFVIDAKRYQGKVRRVDKGGWFLVDSASTSGDATVRSSSPKWRDRWQPYKRCSRLRSSKKPCR
jgi:hypothetical protein